MRVVLGLAACLAFLVCGYALAIAKSDIQIIVAVMAFNGGMIFLGLIAVISTLRRIAVALAPEEKATLMDMTPTGWPTQKPNAVTPARRYGG